MMRLLLFALFALCAVCGPASADEFEAQSFADLGPAASTGQDAYDGFADRTWKLHLSMACGNELQFLRDFAFVTRFGKGGDDPATPDVKESGSWPVTLMLGKAALLGDPRFQEPDPDDDGGAPGCTGFLGTADQVRRDWSPLASGLAFETAVELVNRVYRERFSDAAYIGWSPQDYHDYRPCERVAFESEGPVAGIFITLTPACLARQIRTVMSDPDHGPWKWKDGRIVPELPGTDSKALPCLSEWKTKITEYTGDWDMAVLEYTRLTHLLYGVEPTRSWTALDIAATVEVLNTRFLTLRSSPEQGATAREGFQLAASCGNSPNQFGSAYDTVHGSGSDPGIGRYNADGADALDGTSIWEDILRLLAILAIVAALITAAAVIGGIAAVGFATGIGAIGAVAAAAAILLVLATITFFSGSIQETENHLLMQNSSRYLKNKLMMAELSREGRRDEFDTIADLNEELRIWLLQRMQRIAAEDFIEYNSKPYARLSHFSLLNLIDFACDVQWDYRLSARIRQADADCDPKDRAVVDAAAAVFDLSAAKAAVGSLEGRRLVPYRRLAVENQQYYNGRSLLELGQGADTMLAGLQIWTGQMRHTQDGTAPSGTFGQLVFYSTSRYRPDPMILDIAVDKSTPRTQQYVHQATEAYTSGDGWLITAGGTNERAANGLSFPFLPTIYSFSPTDDRGVGVPTTLMTEVAARPGDGSTFARVQEFLRFDGDVQEWGLEDGKPMVSYSDNKCVAGGFACGLSPRLPKALDTPEELEQCAVPIAAGFVAIDSGRCAQIGAPEAGRGVYIAFYDHDKEWGFFEVVPHSAFASLEDFVAAVRDRNRDHIDDWSGQDADDEITYVRTDGLSLEFTPEDEDFGAARRACGVVNHDPDSLLGTTDPLAGAARFTISDVPAADAAGCRPVGRRILIDLRIADRPVRIAMCPGAEVTCRSLYALY